MTPSPRCGRAVAVMALCCLAALAGCEKKTHRDSRNEFQSLMALRLTDSERARRLEEFVRRYPEPKTNAYLTRACTLLAEHNSREKRPDIAASWYERGVRARPNDPDLLNALGYHYAQNGMNLDRAVSVLERAVDLAVERDYPNRRQGLYKDSLGWAYRMRGDLPLAVALLEEACRMAPDVRILQDHLADTYRAIGEHDRAVEIYLDLYLDGRGTDSRYRAILADLGRETGPDASRDVARRIREGLLAIEEADRGAAEAEGASLVHLIGPDGQPLTGSLFLPQSRLPGAVRGLRGGVLLLHALGVDRRTSSSVARELADAGFVALTLDLRGHGGSVSDALANHHQFSQNLEANIGASEQDASAALDYLRRHPRVDRARIGVIGAGLGGLVAARALIGSDEASRRGALTLLSPWGQAGAYEPLVEILGYDAVLVVAGSGEPAAGIVTKLSSGAGGAPHTLLVEGSEGKGFALLDSNPEAVRRVIEFMTERLR